MPISGIQGQVLQVNVVRCDKLKDTGWMAKQKPYVCVEYGSDRRRTKSCKDGGREPNFHEKFEFSLIEGLQEINLEVWTSHSLSTNAKLGYGKVQLEKVLTDGYDDKAWPIWGESTRHGMRYVGEVYLILRYTKKPDSPPPPPQHGARQVPYAAPPAPHFPFAHGQPPQFYQYYPPAHSSSPGRHYGAYPPQHY